MGQYAITASGDELQGNYSVTFVPGTLAIGQASLVQRVNGELVPVSVSVTPAMADGFGLDLTGGVTPETLEEGMNAKDPNGLMRWENLVTGTATNQLLLSDGVGVNGTEMSLYHAVDPGEGVNLGYDVLYELQRKVGGAWSKVGGPVAAIVPSFSVELLDGSGRSKGASGLYRLVTLLVPKNELSITNAIPTTNCVVVLEVDSSAKNTMTSVPVGGLATDPDKAKSVTVDKLVNVAQLSDGDKVYAMDANGTYQQWTLENGAWQAAAATVRKVGGTMQSIETPEADAREQGGNTAIGVVGDNASKPDFVIGE